MVFTSCLDAKSKGVTDENIEITINEQNNLLNAF